VEEISDIKAVREKVVIGSSNALGTGGIATKIAAAERTVPYSIPTIIANGSKPGALEALAAGKQRGTVFLAEGKK